MRQGLLNNEEIEFSLYDGKYIDYGFLYSVRFPLLRKAFSRFDKSDAAFLRYVDGGNSYDYALYMTLKYESGQKHFYEWENKYKYRDVGVKGVCRKLSGRDTFLAVRAVRGRARMV